MSLSRILGPLAEAGLELDAEAARDAVWLALRIAPYQSGALGVSTADSDRGTGDEPADAISGDAATHREPAPTRPSRDALHERPTAPPSHRVPVGGAAMAAIRLPAAAPLPEARGIARGLRPLRRRVPSSVGIDLDVDATVRRAAEEDIWLPVLRARRERWLDLALVIDDSPSMVVWRDVVREFGRVLRWSGAFRSITAWRAHAGAEPVLFAGHARGAAADRPRTPSSLTALPRRGLVLVVTDCVAEAWYDGSFLTMLARWSRTSPVALIQVLPQRLWGRTALSRGMPVRLHAPAIAATNAHLTGAGTSWLADDDEAGRDADRFLAPIATLDPVSLNQLARLVGGPATDATPGFAFDIAAMRDAGPPPPPRAMPPAERVRRFWSVASSPARRLASAFAASPFLDLRVLRLLRRDLIPGGTHLHEAEVVLGGLLRRDVPEDADDGERDATPRRPGSAADDISFAFAEGVRPLLLDNVATDDALRVLRRAAEIAATDQPDAHLFLAALDDPAAVTTPLERTEGSFAESIAGFLDWLGGPYTRIVAEGPAWEGVGAATEHAHIAEDEPAREPVQSAESERDAAPPWFFVSYARQDYDPYLARFVDELRDAVRVKVGGAASEVAFMDRTDVRPSNDWAASIREALQASRVLVAILSPSYLKSNHAGREWSVFGMRQDAWAASHDGQRPPVIVPVLWSALDDLTRPLPRAVSEIQLAEPSLSPDYASRGARYLMATESGQHMELIHSVAERIVEVGSRFDLPRTELPPDAALPNAFEDEHADATTRSEPEISQEHDPDRAFHELLAELDTMEPESALEAGLKAAHEADAERRFDRSAMLLARRAVLLFEMHRREESQNDLAGASARARDVTDLAHRLDGLVAVARAATEIGDLWLAKELLEEALQMQERLSDWENAAATLNMLAAIHLRRDEHRAAIDRLASAAAMWDRAGDAAARAGALLESLRIALTGDAALREAVPSLLGETVEALRAVGTDAAREALERVVYALQRRRPGTAVPYIALFGHQHDARWAERLDRALGVFVQIGAIRMPSTAGLGSDGSNWRPGSADQLEQADIVLLLVSQDLLKDDRTVERVERIAAASPGRVVPLFIERVDRTAFPWLREIHVQASASRPLSDQPPELQAQIIADMAGRAVELALESTADRPAPSDLETPLVRLNLLDIPAEPNAVSENDLYALDRAWKTRQRPLVVVNGPSGAGKTTLLNAWLDSLREADYRDADILFGWSFYSDADLHDPDAAFDRFLVQALDWLRVGDRRTPVDRALRLCTELAKQRSLLLLDGIERLAGPTGPDAMRSRGSSKTARPRHHTVDSPLALPEALVALLDTLLDRSGFLAVLTTTTWSDRVAVGYRTPPPTDRPRVLHFPPEKILRIDLPDRAALA